MSDPAGSSATVMKCKTIQRCESRVLRLDPGVFPVTIHNERLTPFDQDHHHARRHRVCSCHFEGADSLAPHASCSQYHHRLATLSMIPWALPYCRTQRSHGRGYSGKLSHTRTTTFPQRFSWPRSREMVSTTLLQFDLARTNSPTCLILCMHSTLHGLGSLPVVP